MNLRYKLTYDLFVGHSCTGGLEFVIACRNADSLARINQIVDDLKARDRRNRNFVIVDTNPDQEREMTMSRSPKIRFEPVDRFPALGQSGIYFLGKFAEDCNPAQEMSGAIIIFNARRHTVRAYRFSRRNAQRIAQSSLPWGDYRVGDDTHYAYCDRAPSGALLPSGDAILYARDGVVIWCNGRVGYLATREQSDEWTQAELDGYNLAQLALRANCTSSDIWGCLIKFSLPSPAPDGLSWLGDLARNLREDVAIEDLTGDYDDCEFCAAYVVALETFLV